MGNIHWPKACQHVRIVSFLRETDHPTGAGSIRVALSTVSRPPGRQTAEPTHPGVRSPCLRDRGRLIETPRQHEGDRSILNVLGTETLHHFAVQIDVFSVGIGILHRCRPSAVIYDVGHLR